MNHFQSDVEWNYEKKLCKICGGRLQKWGKDAREKQRFRCPKCGQSHRDTRPKLTETYRRQKYEKYLGGKLSLSEIAACEKVNRRTLNNWFAPLKKLDVAPTHLSSSGQVLIMDGYFHCFGAVALIGVFTDGIIPHWCFTYSETAMTWMEFLEGIRETPLAIVGDGQKGMFLAIKYRFPRVLFQRCQFHVIAQVGKLLTKNPETEAAIRFKQIVGKITRVKTNYDLRCWIIEYKQWYTDNEDLIKEKTYQEKLTPTSRRKWHYTHGRLHAAFSHVKNAFPYLFTYLKDPNIPNTSNLIEGGINSQIQRKLDVHRGANIYVQRQIIAAFLKSKQPQKPTQNFP